MRIVAFGCSFTQGVGLEPHITQDTQETSKLAWPQLVADNLNCEVFNAGFGGSSPKHVYHDIINFNFQPDDFVCVLWPSIHRGGILQEDGSFYDICPSQEQHEDYFVKYHTKINSIWDFCTINELTQNFLSLRLSCPSYSYMMSLDADVVYATNKKIKKILTLSHLKEKYGTCFFRENQTVNTNMYFKNQFQLFPSLKKLESGFLPLSKAVENGQFEPIETELVTDGHYAAPHHCFLAHRISVDILKQLGETNTTKEEWAALQKNQDMLTPEELTK